MERTPFAGLTALDENDPITIDGSSFLIRNPRITDTLLQIGAVTHHHDGHRPVPNPHVPLTGFVSSGGSMSASANFALTYTLMDSQGGETAGAPPLLLSTGGQIPAPSVAPSAGVVTSAGILPAGDYYYAQTYTDGAGGETTLGPQTLITVPPGFASASILLVDLADELSPNGQAVEWRLWRSYEGADWHLVVQSGADSFADAGFDPPDNPARPPGQNTTGGTFSLVVTIPTAIQDTAIASATAINLYLAADAGFADPCFYQQLPVASAGTTIVIRNETISQGSPPAVSLSKQGANQINPDTDILDWHWKRPVATSALLPSGSQGDVRLTVDTGHLWGVLGASGAVGGGGLPGWTDLFAIGAELAHFVALASGGASATVGTELEFKGAGIAQASVQDLGGGSAVVTYSVTQQGVGVGGSGAVPLIDPTSYVEFVGSGLTGVATTSLGGGSARVLISAGIPGGSGLTLAGSAGINHTGVETYAEFAGSGGIAVALQDLGGGSARVVVGAGLPYLTQFTASAELGGSARVASMLEFDADGIGQVSVQDLGGGSGLVTFTVTPAFTASALGGASANAVNELEFAGAGIAAASVLDLGGGSGLVTITATAPGIGVGGPGAVPLIDPMTYVEFTGSGLTGVSTTALGGGSARVLISAGQAGGSGVTLAGSAGTSRTGVETYIEFAASSGVDAAVQDLGGGSARVLIGLPNTLTATTQASGHAFGAADLGTVVESTSSGSVGYLINPSAQTPLPLGGVIEVFQYGAGQVQIVPSGGVLLRSDGNKSKTAAQYATIGLRQRATDEWVLTGDLA